MAFGDFYKMFDKDFGTGEFLQGESNQNSLFVSSLKTVGRSLVSFVTEPIAGVVNFFAPGKGDIIRDSVYSHVGSETLLKSDKTKMDSIKTWVGSLLGFGFGLECLVASPFYDIYDGGRKLFFLEGYQEHLNDLDKKAMVQKLINFEKNFLDFYRNNDFFSHCTHISKIDGKSEEITEKITFKNKDKIPEIKQKIYELLEEWKQIDAYFQKGYCVPDENEQKVHKDRICELKQFFKKVLYPIEVAGNSINAFESWKNVEKIINENVIAVKSGEKLIDVSQISNDISSIDENAIVVKSRGKDGNVKKQFDLEPIEEDVDREDNYNELENENKNINDIPNNNNIQNNNNFNDNSLNDNNQNNYEGENYENQNNNNNFNESNNNFSNNNNIKNKDNNIDDNSNINDENDGKLTILKNIEYDDNDENDGKKIHSIVNLKNKNDEIINNNNFNDNNIIFNKDNNDSNNYQQQNNNNLYNNNQNCDIENENIGNQNLSHLDSKLNKSGISNSSSHDG